ncbi:MAG: sodium:solute symporter [Vicinamibacteria bacterium]
MSSLDWTVLLVYLAAIVSFGVFMGRGNKKISDFFLAGREMRWWAVGLSVMATQISAITFVGTTGQAYTDGMRFLVVYFGLPFAMVILCVTLVPFFYRAGVFTAYEYLEKRFDWRTRTLTSLLFLISRGLSVGVTLYAPSLVLSVILGWSEGATILLMAGTTIIYVIYGGNKSVIWTDVVQMTFIWFGIFLCVGVAISRLPAGVGLRDALALAQTTGRLRIIDLSPSLAKPYTFWSGLIGGLFLMLSYFGCDQSQVQRYLSGSSLTQSRLSLLFSAFLKVPMQFLILLTGILVFVFYHFQPPPLLWNPVALARFEGRAPKDDVARLEERYANAVAERRASAEAFLAAHRHGSTDAERYLGASRELDAVRTEAAGVMGRLDGAVYRDTNYIFPTYIVTQLPRGLVGLVIAVIFAAAMSALSGELSALATASMVDFYRRFVSTGGGDAQELLVSRILTGVWGGFACLVALEAGHLGSAIEVVNKFGSYFYGSILGVFGLAVLTPTASARGAFYGLIIGVTTVVVVATLSPIHFLWYNVVGAVTVFAVGLGITALAPPKT